MQPMFGREIKIKAIDKSVAFAYDLRIMGCDIHTFIEVTDNYSNGYTYWRLRSLPDLSRDYALFGLLAGVRSNYLPMISPPRGLPTPKDKSFEDMHNKLYSAHREAKYSRNESVLKAERIFIDEMESGPGGAISRDTLTIYLRGFVDYHSSSWLTLAELKAYDWDQEIEVEQMYLWTEAMYNKKIRFLRKIRDSVPVNKKLLEDTWKTFSEESEKLVKISLRDYYAPKFHRSQIFDCIKEMERVKIKGATDEHVRLVFWFDN